MKKLIFQRLLCLSLLALPLLLTAQGNPARGEPYFPGSKTFHHVIGTFTSGHQACAIMASPDLDGEHLEYIVFTRTKGAANWALADSGTIQQAGYERQLCFPDAKMVMVVLSCRQKNGGTVTFGPKRCPK